MRRHTAVASLGLGLLLSVQAHGAEPSTQGTSAENGERMLTLSGGVDAVSSYYWRGYLQEDSGLILQPYVELDAAVWKQQSMSLTPFVRSWNSIHSKTEEESTNHNESHWYQSDLMVGAKLGMNDFQVTPFYTYTQLTDFGRGGLDVPGTARAVTPNNTVQEVGVRLAYDDRAVMRRLGSPVTINPYILYARETSEDVLGRLAYPVTVRYFGNTIPDGYAQPTTATYQYIEAGLSPSIAIENTPVTLIFPIAVGMSPDGLYQHSADPRGGSEFGHWQDTLIGYWSAGVTASTALPVPHRFGAWRLDVGVTYLALTADSTRLQNNGAFVYSIANNPDAGHLRFGTTSSGEDHAWIVRVGLAFSY